MRSLIVTIISLYLVIQLSFCNKDNYPLKVITRIKDSTVLKDSFVITNKEVTKEVIKEINNQVNIETSLKNPCDSNGKLVEGQLFKLKNGNNYLLLKVKNGELLLDSYQDSVVQLNSTIKELKDSMLFIKETTKSVFENNEKTIIDNTKELNRWQKFKISHLFDVVLVLVICSLLYIIFKLIIK